VDEEDIARGGLQSQRKKKKKIIIHSYLSLKKKE
jgi:hypothetical protein